MAEIFVTKGYGLGIVKETSRGKPELLDYIISCNHYNSILTSIMKSALRKLV